MANPLLTTMLGLVLVATVCNCLEFSYDYLKRPQRFFLQSDEMYRIKLLKRLDLKDGASYEQVIESLRALMSDKKNEHIQTWLELANPNGKCSKNLPNTFVDLYDNIKQSKTLEHKQLLLDTLTHYGAIKFNSCVSRALKIVEVAEGEKQLLEAERFFKRVLSLNENVSERDFYRKLRTLNVRDADWNVGLLLSEAHDYDKEDFRNRDFVRDKYHFLFVDNCRTFDAHMTQPLEIINLANDLKPDANHFKDNIRLKKLNELKRVCMDFWRNEPEFLANLAKKISLKSRVKNKLGL